MPQPQILTDSQAGNPLSTGDQDGGWVRKETADDGIGPGKGDVIPKSIAGQPRPRAIKELLLKRKGNVKGANESKAEDPETLKPDLMPEPRILTQRNEYANSTPINLHRKFNRSVSAPENPNPAAFVGLGMPNSQGVGQYFYAPGEGNLSKNIAARAGLLMRSGEFGRGGGGPAMVSEVLPGDPQASDSDLAVLLGPDGYLPFPGDSRFERKPDGLHQPPKHDKDVSLPSPTFNVFDVGNESMFYPAALIQADGATEWTEKVKQWMDPKRVQGWATRAKGMTPAAASAWVGQLSDKLVAPVDGKPSPYGRTKEEVVKYLRDAFTKDGVKLAEEGATKKDEPKKPAEEAPKATKEAAPKEAPTAKAPKEAPKEAAKEVPKEDTAEGRLDRLKIPKSALETWGEKFKSMDPAGVDKELKDYAKTIHRDTGKTYGDISDELIVTYLKTKLTEAGFKVPEVPLDEDEEAEALEEPTSANEKKHHARKVPDFNTVSEKRLGRYMLDDDQEKYDALPHSTQAYILEEAKERLGNAAEKGLTIRQVQLELNTLLPGADTWRPPKKEKTAPAKLGKDGLPEDMTEQERLFRGVSGWRDDYQGYTGDDITGAIQDVLKKKPEGNGKYFQWQYSPAQNPKLSTLVVIRKQPWKDFQESNKS